MIESTVPRPSVEALEERKRALRRVRTDPADCEAHIAQALLSEGLDLAALAAQVMSLTREAVLKGPPLMHCRLDAGHPGDMPGG